MRRGVRSWLRRALARLGLAPLADVERERRRSRAIREAERRRRLRERQRARDEIARALDRLRRARARIHDLRAARAGHADRLAAVTATLRALGAKTDRLTRVLDGPLPHLRSRLAVRARLLREARHGSASAAGRAADLDREFAAACARWTAGDRPEAARQVSMAGLSFAVPADTGDPGSLSGRILGGWLPLQDLARVRPYIVGGVMLDIGANVGTTCIPRVVLGDFSTAYAAEPDEANYRCLVGNIVDNGLTSCVIADRAAIADTDGTARLRRSGRMGAHRLVAPGSDDAAAEVRCFRVDTWITRLGVAPADVAFVKVDVEGWDVHVLEGASGLLDRRQAVWQIEVSPRLMALAGSTPGELIAIATSRFTHVQVLESFAPPAPSSSLPDLLASMPDEHAKVNLLLWNVSEP
jgi:FkbM family methyltransferase